MAAIIELDRINFTYDQAVDPAIQDMTIKIEKGSLVGIIGPSGSGKTTLTRILSGAIPHHCKGQLEGTARIAHLTTCMSSITDISREIGVVLQDIDASSVAACVEDEILFGLENFGVAHSEIEHRLGQALDTVGITDLRDREIATLSGGQKQKVALAAILALRPHVMVLDAPTSALDPMSARSIFEALLLINREQGITVVVSEQSGTLPFEFCDRIIVLDHGRIAFDGTAREVLSHTDSLLRIGTDVPQMARVSTALKAETPSLNVDEAYGLIRSRISPISCRRITSARAQRTSCEKQLPPAISLRSASFSYPRNTASVKNLSIDIFPGEIVAVVGENGAGKTTLTKLVNGLIRPQTGSVHICGSDTRNIPASTIASQVATLFQNPDRQLCRPTALQEVAFGLEARGLTATQAARRARTVLERFGIAPDVSPFAMTRNERHLTALASLVAMQPRIMLLDEPTGGLDLHMRLIVMNEARVMAEQGCAVLFVCHDMEIVNDYAHRVAVMGQGRIHAIGSTIDVFRDKETLRAGRILPPQIRCLSDRLSTTLSPAFKDVANISELISCVKELSSHD